MSGKFREVMSWLNVLVIAIMLAAVVTVQCSGATAPASGVRCAAPEIVKRTPEDWSERDQRAFDTASARCAELYPRSPCMIQFIRMEQGRYRAVCGNKRERNEFDLRIPR